MTCDTAIVSLEVMYVLQGIMKEVHSRALPGQGQI
jgi:hypothetical protein